MSEWKMVRLGDIFDLQMGKTPDRNRPEYFNTNTNKWVSIADISKAQKYILETKECISDEAVKNSGIKQIPANTIIMSFKLSIGKTAITTEPMYSNEAIMAFLPNGKYEVDNDFFYHLFSNKNWSEGSNKAVKGVTLNKATLTEVKIPLPPLDEQKQIADVLDKCADIIAKRKQQLSALDELIKSRFVEMFGDVIENDKGWPQYIFEDITESRLGKMLDAKQQKGNCKFPYLANFNVQWFRFELKNLNEMDFDKEDQVEFELKDGDLLVCEGGEIGRCAVWHNELQPCFFQKALHRVRCNKDVLRPEYLAWWFKYNCEYGGFSAIEGAKATISHLPGAKLKKLIVTVPAKQCQDEFVNFVAQIDKTKEIIQKSLEKTQLLFDSLMQEYFG